MHLKRIAMPKSWPLPRKETKFINKPRGPHPLRISLPIVVILRDILKIAHTKKEVKKILQDGLILIDNKIIKDEKFGIGLFDRIYMKKLEKTFTMHLTKKGKFKVEEINKEKANKKPCKITGKKIIKNNKIQINLHDGKNFIINKKDTKVGDTVLIDLKTNKIVSFLKLNKGISCLIIGGKHMGEEGEIFKIEDKISIKIKDKIFKITKDKIFVIEKNE